MDYLNFGGTYRSLTELRCMVHFGPLEIHITIYVLIVLYVRPPGILGTDRSN